MNCGVKILLLCFAIAGVIHCSSMISYDYWTSCAGNIVVKTGNIDSASMLDQANTLGFNTSDCSMKVWKYELFLNGEKYRVSIFMNYLPANGAVYSVPPETSISSRGPTCSNIQVYTFDSIGNEVPVLGCASCSFTGIPYNDSVTLIDMSTNLPIPNTDLQERHGARFKITWGANEIHGDLYWGRIIKYRNRYNSPSIIFAKRKIIYFSDNSVVTIGMEKS